MPAAFFAEVEALSEITRPAKSVVFAGVPILRLRHFSRKSRPSARLRGRQKAWFLPGCPSSACGIFRGSRGPQRDYAAGKKRGFCRRAHPPPAAFFAAVEALSEITRPAKSVVFAGVPIRRLRHFSRKSRPSARLRGRQKSVVFAGVPTLRLRH